MIELTHDYDELVEELKPEVNELLVECRIAVLVSDKEKKSKDRLVHADCRKVDAQYQWCCPYDFMITLYKNNIRAFSPEQMRILLKHELMHAGVEVTADGELKFSIKPYDIEDFREILEQYGVDWDRKVYA